METLIKITNEAEAKAYLDRLDGADYTVKSVKKGTRKKNPAPPFITSTLQQEASRKLGFQAERTMRAAQELYEAVWKEKFLPGSNNTVMVHIRRLRSKMREDTRQDKIITTVWGVGYKIEK